MALTPAHIFDLARKRHLRPWNWTLHLAAVLLFCLALLFHSYLILAASFIFLGTGFFDIDIPKPDNRWFVFVRRGTEWEKNWTAAPWNWTKWWKFIAVMICGIFALWALWTTDLAILLLILAFAYLWRVMAENRNAGIEP